MNGRAYDYNLGRFLSVDPIIQFPANSQSLNPYSYLMNNPMSGTDPSGYVACSSSDDSSGECGVTWEGQGDTRSVNKTSNRTGTFNTSYSVTSTTDANIVRTQTGSGSQTYVINNGGANHTTVAGSDQPNQVGSPSENGKTGEGNQRAVSSETFFALNQQEQQGYFSQLTAGAQPDIAQSYAYWDLLWDIPVLGYDLYLGITTGDWTAFGTDAILAVIPGVPAGAGLAVKAGKGSKLNKLEPVKTVDGPHTTWKTDQQSGQITRHETWTPNSRNPSGFDKVQSTDIVGRPHVNSVTGQSVPTPHTQGRNIPGGVRPARPDEVPRQ